MKEEFTYINQRANRFEIPTDMMPLYLYICTFEEILKYLAVSDVLFHFSLVANIVVLKGHLRLQHYAFSHSTF